MAPTFRFDVLATRAAPLVVLLAGCGASGPSNHPPPAPTGARYPMADLAAVGLGGQPSWLYPADACPADVASPVGRDVEYLGDRCAPDLGPCVRGCREGDGNACYAAALRIQDLNEDERTSEALFLRACRLGMVSGCTNRAAGIMKLAPNDERGARCATRTFELTCAEDDPWGCSMLGFNLARGIGTAQNLQRARAVLPRACRLGQDDPACEGAIQILKQIDGSVSP